MEKEKAGKRKNNMWGDIDKVNELLDSIEPSSEQIYFPYDVFVDGVFIKAGTTINVEKNRYPITRPEK